MCRDKNHDIKNLNSGSDGRVDRGTSRLITLNRFRQESLIVTKTYLHW